MQASAHPRLPQRLAQAPTPTAQQQQQSDAFIAACNALQPTRDYKGLYRKAQDAEFFSTPTYSFILESVLGLELVAALCQHDLTNARFCWKRIPENLTATQGGSRVLKALHKIGEALWEKNQTKFHQAVAAYLSSFNDDPVITPWVRMLQEEEVTRTTDLIARSYSNIDVKQVAQMLGYATVDEVKSHLPTGWTLSGSSVVPAQKARPAPQNADEQLLQRMVEYVSHLEAPVLPQVVDEQKEEKTKTA